ncbi:uncharacterized protein A1O5_02512 [Cladophialophora psammophila CBS 110553]|uniref:Uncharacterized protein n=1 Tax=Cladophialophora psammophila CBS 110553 TaxID=1182543 RepID=W9X164_9EURO|nr:uncharacterized protein A1O5_02512 [Cladophialophora psammophila CBS 110553]EXJ74217.1 hypothetical protein A1O5_02512 [Cladophialophora psammophila CBS 110553]
MDDELHTSCYIFTPTTQGNEEIDPSPRKKRKLDKAPSNGAQEEYSWPRVLGGQESREAVTWRKSAFETIWAEQQEKIDGIVNVVDEEFVGPVIRYGRTQKADDLRNGKRLKTALLALGPNTKHHHDVHEARKCTVPDKTHGEPELLVSLQPSHCPNIQIALKNVVRSAISGQGGVEEYTEFLNEHKALIPLAFDLELLHRYVQRHSVERVVISIMDVESFDTTVFCELISTFHSWSDRIPIILFIGISTTVELFESRLSRLTVSLLDAQIFETSSHLNVEDRLFALYATIQHGQNADVFLGPSVVRVLATLAEDQGSTPETFARAIKYAYMSHFFANPLSMLCIESGTPSPWPPVLCQATRNLASFRAYCEALGKGDQTQREMVRHLLTYDDDLEKAAVLAIRSGKDIMRSSLCAISTLRYIYHRRLKLKAYTTWESEMHLLQSLPGLDRSELFEAIEDKLQSLPPGTPITQFLGESAPELEDLQDFQRSSAQDSDSEARADAETSHLSEPEKFITLLRRYLQSRTSSPSSSSPCDGLNPFREFMAESYTVSQKSPLSQTIHPRPRHCVERALARPADYLGCTCCVSQSGGEDRDVSDKASLPPTSLLLNMLNEAGVVVNVRDLWDAFRDTLLHGARSRSDADAGIADHDRDVDVDANDDEANETDDQDTSGKGDAEAEKEREALSLFYRALAELRYLGLIKPSKRKPGVECIAKTAWMGL